MNARKFAGIVAGLIGSLVLSHAANAAPVDVDGVLGTEWGGVSSVHVGFDPSTPTSNFGSPGTTNHNVAYDIFLRSDSDYIYGVLQAAGPTNGMEWANLYFDIGRTGGGSNFGIEITNARTFIPGVAGYFNDVAPYLSYVTNSATGTIEWALSWTYFTDDPSNIFAGGVDISNGAQLRLSQSFGYSVAGGPNYPDRLGSVNGPKMIHAVPEPASLLLISVALAGLAVSRRRGKQGSDAICAV